jgi:hypothetical protein
METNIENAILPIKLNELIEFVMQKKKISWYDALSILFSSSLYTNLHKEDAKFWYLSAAALYDLLEKEIKVRNQSEKLSSNQLMFITFCIENYNHENGLSASDALYLFTKYRVFEFLIDGFDVLHTQSKEYILSEIELFLKNRM